MKNVCFIRRCQANKNEGRQFKSLHRQNDFGPVGISAVKEREAIGDRLYFIKSRLLQKEREEDTIAVMVTGGTTNRLSW